MPWILEIWNTFCNFGYAKVLPKKQYQKNKITMNAHFVKSTYSILTFAIILASCSSVRPVGKVNNYDDAYFSTADLNGKGFYAEGSMPSAATGEASAKAGSYGQTYSDRLRNFGGSSLQPTHSPAVMVQPCTRLGMGFSPWGGNPFMGNPMMMGSAWGNPWGSPWGNPMMMGGQSWNSFNDPYWMYYNQMYNPNMYWGGGSFGGWNNNSWNNNGWNNWSNNGSNNGWNNGNNGSGSSSSGGFINNPRPASGSSGFSNGGSRRNNYQTGMPATQSNRSSAWNNSSPAPSNNGGSTNSRSSNWTPSNNTQQGSFNGGGSGRSSNAVPGTSGRRR
jgi:hypothetical protein